jgi:hypothetical protein
VHANNPTNQINETGTPRQGRHRRHACLHGRASCITGLQNCAIAQNSRFSPAASSLSCVQVSPAYSTSDA